jgi:hypothetical protein
MGRWTVRRDRYDTRVGVLQGTGAQPGPLTEARTSGHRDFLQTNYALLAFHAWRGYQAYGRGAVLLWERQLHTREGYRPATAQLFYLSEGHPPFPGWPDRYVATAVQDYDPRREVLVIINLREGGIAFHRVRQGYVDPPDANPHAPSSDPTQ